MVRCSKNFNLTSRSTNEIIDLVPRCSKLSTRWGPLQSFFFYFFKKFHRGCLVDAVLMVTLAWRDSAKMTISFDLNRTRYWNLSKPPNVGIFSGRQEIWESNLVIRVRDGIVHLAVFKWIFLIKKIYVFILYIYIIFILRI